MAEASQERSEQGEEDCWLYRVMETSRLLAGRAEAQRKALAVVR